MHGLCGALAVLERHDNGDRVVGYCVLRATHEGRHSPELTTIVRARQLEMRPAA